MTVVIRIQSIQIGSQFAVKREVRLGVLNLLVAFRGILFK